MKYIYEFIGTFFLVFTVGMTTIGPHSAGVLAPLAIGSILAVMIYACGHVSGGHLNPAVTLAAYVSKKIKGVDVIAYWIAQMAAGIAAAYLTLYFKGEQTGAPMELEVTKAILVEFLFTFALCFVVLNTATAIGTKGNSFYGFAIGFTVLAGAYTVGAISSAAFNPAVALGISIMHVSAWSNLWIYLTANLVAGACAAFVFKPADV